MMKMIKSESEKEAKLSALDELMGLCKEKMVEPYKKRKEAKLKIEVEPEAEEAAEATEEAAESAAEEAMEDMDLDALMELYQKMKE